ncbi:MAG: peptidylprolyl isomerase [Deltaproteobacteria bacterium]|nr:peptidylprolyl isomerase [Deltaproteobacteria bacterium]MBW2050847.1 peptidylprolyl isomerase [Deltaproteobacteria bacterium]MBW2140167.1 peptidylprolyl isomerase [Deltaproteobacteria bacterium]MBW2322310.1 peptidylprolyl isomerase [Deltaproteobacteria bacterium]
MRKHLNYASALIITLLLAANVPAAGAAEAKRPGNGKVAIVNGTAIFQAEFDNELAFFKQRFKSQGKPLSDAQIPLIKKDILENLITRELLYQAGQKAGAAADKSKVNEQFENLKKRFPSEAEFKKALSGRKLSEADLKTQIEKGMVIQSFIEKQFAQKTTITEKEIKAYYDEHLDSFKQPEQVRASHILIKVDSQADKALKTKARKKIEKIKQRLSKGEDFAALAKEFSDCPSADKGGDLGYFKRGQMVKPFEEAAFLLKPDKISDIVETGFGYHLIKVTDKKAEKITGYENAKSKISPYLKQNKIQKEIRLYAEELKEKADIDRLLTGNSEN